MKTPSNIKVEYREGSDIRSMIRKDTQSKIKIKRIKIYEHNKLVRMFNFNDYENFKNDETMYFYDNNSTSYTSKITRDYNTKDEILYYEIERDAKDKYIYAKYFYDKSVKDKGKIHSLTLYIQHNPEISHWFRYSQDGTVEAEGYSIRRGGRGSFKWNFNKKGIKVKEHGYYYNTGNYNEILHGFYSTYDDNGTLKSEKYYEHGNYIYGSYCNFDTTNYLYRLEKKYDKNMMYTSRANTHCKKISDNIYAIATAYDYGDEDDLYKANLILSIVNTKTKEIIESTYNENTKFKNPSNMKYFANNSYDAQINSDIFDFVSSEGIIISYKITPESIELLEKVTYNLKEILKSVKSKKSLSAKNIDALLKEVKIDSKSVTTYNDIAYYLQKNKYHKDAILILQHLLDRYPNRTVAYLNMADSLYELNKKDSAKSYYINYTRWMKFYNKENKIPKYVLKRIK